MTAIGPSGEQAVRAAAVALPRRIVTNLATAIALVGRRARPMAARVAAAPDRAWLAALLIAGCVAVPIAMIFLDAAAIAATTRLPLWLINGFNEITDFGKSGWFLWPSGLMLVAVAALATPALGRIANLVLIAIMVRLEFVFLAIGIPGLVVTIGKRLIGRVRPSELGPFDYVPFSWRADYASLPSGHATTAFGAAIAIGALYPRTRPWLWIYAAVIGLSRVVISAHYPSDVIAGAIVGTVGTLVVRRWFAARGLAFAFGADGRVRAMAGPSLHRIKTVARRIAGN